MSTPHPLLAELRRRGVELRREGDRLRWRAPRGVLRPMDLIALRRAKVELLNALAPPDQAPPDHLDDAPIIDTRAGVGVLIRSRRYGCEVWVALDRDAAGKLEADEAQRADTRPVLFADDVARLRGKSEGAVRGALEVARALPGRPGAPVSRRRVIALELAGRLTVRVGELGTLLGVSENVARRIVPQLPGRLHRRRAPYSGR